MSDQAVESIATPTTETQPSGVPHTDGHTPEPVAQETPVSESPTRNMLDFDDTPAESKPKASWMYDENTPGEGEKPEWFNDSKYKTLADQAKAQPELRKLLSNFTGAPEEYEFNLDPVLEMNSDEVNREDPMFKAFLGWAKDSNLSQEGFDQILNMQLVNEQSMARDFKQTLDSFADDQLALLNDDERNQLKPLKQWGKNNLPEDLFEDFVEMADTAGGVRVLLSMKNNFIAQKIPTELPSTKQLQPHQLAELQKDPRYKRDPTYQQWVLKQYQAAQ